MAEVKTTEGLVVGLIVDEQPEPKTEKTAEEKPQKKTRTTK